MQLVPLRRGQLKDTDLNEKEPLVDADGEDKSPVDSGSLVDFTEVGLRTAVECSCLIACMRLVSTLGAYKVILIHSFNP
jgi:hypothetical protein